VTYEYLWVFCGIQYHICYLCEAVNKKMILYGSTPGLSGRIAERYLEGFRFDAWMGVKMPDIDTRVDALSCIGCGMCTN